MSEKIKQALINSTVLLLSLSFSILGIEILLRVFSKKLLLRVDHHKLFCEYDSLLGWRKVPNASGQHITDEYMISENFNSQGIRGPEYPYNKFTDEYRILTLGDSFTEGYTVEFNELFSEVLKRELNNRGDRYYEVINAGTGGYSTDQELLFFQNEGKKYIPDLTILMFCINDVWYNNQSEYPRAYKPLFKLEDGELRLTNVPVPKPVTTSALVAVEKSLLQNIKEWLNRKSYVYNFTRRVKNSHYWHALAVKLGWSNSQEPPIPDVWLVIEKTYNAEIRAAWEVTEAILIKLHREILSAGSKLLVFYIPPRPSIYFEYWQAMKRQYGLSDENWNPEQAGIELESICKRNNINLIKPTKRFITEVNKAGKKRKWLHFIKDGHWNAEGHKFVGEILAQYINQGP